MILYVGPVYLGQQYFGQNRNAYFSISIWFPLFQMVVWYLMISYAGETDKMRLVGFFPPCYLIISEFIMQFCQKLLERGTKTGLSCSTDLVAVKRNTIKNAVNYVSFLKITLISPKIVAGGPTNFPQFPQVLTINLLVCFFGM